MRSRRRARHRQVSLDTHSDDAAAAAFELPDLAAAAQSAFHFNDAKVMRADSAEEAGHPIWQFALVVVRHDASRWPPLYLAAGGGSGGSSGGGSMGGGPGGSRRRIGIGSGGRTCIGSSGDSGGGLDGPWAQITAPPDRIVVSAVMG